MTLNVVPRARCPPRRRDRGRRHWPAHGAAKPELRAGSRAQLAAFDRSAADPARAEQIRRFEEAASNQQAEIDRQQAHGAAHGLREQQLLRAVQRPAGAVRPAQRQDPADAGQSRPHPGRPRPPARRVRPGARRPAPRHPGGAGAEQLRPAVPRGGGGDAAAARGGLFESLFGPGSIFSPGSDAPGWSSPGGTYRTVCVRTCDGFYFPISFATVAEPASPTTRRPASASCPAAEVMLFTHRNPGEDMSQAVSISGQLYIDAAERVPLSHRRSIASCSCRQPGETWAQALKNIDDTTVERGDIVVNEERARQMSQPRVDAQGKPIKPDPRAARQARSDGGRARRCRASCRGHRPAAGGRSRAVKPDPKRARCARSGRPSCRRADAATSAPLLQKSKASLLLGRAAP